MSAPLFNVLLNVTNPVPGQQIAIQIFSTEELLTDPVVKIDAVRFATFLVKISAKQWRYTYIPANFDNGDISISGTALSGDHGQTIIPSAFSIKGAGDASAPFGMFPFGYGYFSDVNTLLPPSVDLATDPYQFVIRRGAEGPQVVTRWLNPDSLGIRLYRKEIDYALVEADPDGTLVSSSNGTYYSDIYVVDNTVYYYTLFMETSLGSGTYVRVAKGNVLAIDNQPAPDFTAIEPVISRTTAAQPALPSEGDRYLLPASSTGAAWGGNDGEYAVYASGAWAFFPPKDRWYFNVLDEDIWVALRLGTYVEVPVRNRIDFYEHLESFDHEEDKSSAYAVQSVAQDAALDNEQFNFDIDQTKGTPTLRRFLKTFNLPYNEWEGLTRYISELYVIREVDQDYLLRSAALIGYQDYELLTDAQRRFLIDNMAEGFYPKVGSDAAVSLAIQMWLGTDITVTQRRMHDTVLIANQIATPVVADGEVWRLYIGGPATASANITIVLDTLITDTIAITIGDSAAVIGGKIAAGTYGGWTTLDQLNGIVTFTANLNGDKTGTFSVDVTTTGVVATLTPVATGGPDVDVGTLYDTYGIAMTTRWTDLYHSRGLAFYITNPFDPVTFLPQDSVIAKQNTPPGGPTTSDRYLLGTAPTGAWAGEANHIATWGGATWTFETPADRWSVLETSTGDTYVWKYQPSPGVWWKAVPLESLVRLEWWLRNYAAPGSVYFEFIEEIPGPGTLPLITDFEDWAF